MVVDEVVERQSRIAPVRPKLAVQGIGDLEVVAVHEARVQALVALVVGDRVEGVGVGPATVVPVDDLTEDPELRVDGSAPGGQRPKEVEVYDVGGVQPQAIDTEVLDPRPDRTQEVFSDSGIAEVQLDQVEVAVPALV